MRLLFVYWAFENQGSGSVIKSYTQAAQELGHEVAVYGRANSRIPLNYTSDVGTADAVIFLFEWTTKLGHADQESGDQLDLIRLIEKIPRRRRVILDGDGNYNDIIGIDGDYNHRNEDDSRRWIDLCDGLADKICQPTIHPHRPNVRPFLFYAYNPNWAVPLNPGGKEFGMIYVGHSKFRWSPMERVLRAIEPVRKEVGRIALLGEGWGGMPWWAEPMNMEQCYWVDRDYLDELRAESLPPVPFRDVIDWMSKGVFNPILLRPTFNEMKLVTPRVFETPAANTIPLFNMSGAHVREIYGDEALELLLPEERPEHKIEDIMHRPGRYAEMIGRIRERLESRHSNYARLNELIEIIQS